ncbi:MAG: helix-turn-helix domain-containing protein [Oscillospiraceae bacterium]|nr:helix-turn-helix domain-containing protein [Oscillospiraceae bacterium]
MQIKTIKDYSKPLTEKQLDIVMEYLAGGSSYRDLLKKHGIAVSTIHSWVKKYKTFNNNAQKPIDNDDHNSLNENDIISEPTTVMTPTNRKTITYWLLDYENTHKQGLHGIENLKSNDIVYIFYSNATNIPEFNHKIAPKCTIILKQTENGTKNALDFQLSSQLGYLIHENINANYESRYVIVSKDKGYGTLQSFWKDIADISYADDLNADAEIEAIQSIISSVKTKAELNMALIRYYNNDTQHAGKTYRYIISNNLFNSEKPTSKPGFPYYKYDSEIITILRSVKNSTELNNMLQKHYSSNGQKASQLASKTYHDIINDGWKF